MVCVRGASALDALLAEFPGAQIQVQLVWEPVLKTDIAAPLTGTLGRIDDPRVVQYWDPQRVISADLVRAVDENPSRFGFEEALPDGYVAWDAVVVFDGAARWERDVPTPLYYGGPVVDVVDDPRKAIAQALSPSPPSGRAPPSTSRAAPPRAPGSDPP